MKRNHTTPLSLQTLEAREVPAGLDPNDAMSEAQELSVSSGSPAIVTGIVADPTDVNMYRVYLQAGQHLDLDIDTVENGFPGLGSYLRLFDANGAQLAANNDATAPGETVYGFDAYIGYNITSSGWYYIGASNWLNTAYNPATGDGDYAGYAHLTGNYTLTISATGTDDPDDQIGEARTLAVTPGSPATISDTVSVATDVDMYRVYLEAGQRVELDIDTVENGFPGLGSYLRLFDSQGNQLAANNDATAPGETVYGFDAYIGYEITTSGWYYVGASNWLNTQYNAVSGDGDYTGYAHLTGDYTLIITAVETVLPDLVGFQSNYRVPSSVSGSFGGPIPVGTAFNFETVIQNRGTGPAGSFTVSLYASTDGTIDPATDHYVGSLGTVSGLAAGQFHNMAGTFTLPLTLPTVYSGTIFLGIVVDPTNAVRESEELNNSSERLGGDTVQAQLYDPVAPRGFWRNAAGRVVTFATRADAVRFLEARGFTRPTLGITDAGWSRPLTTATFSRFNGTTMPADAFRIQAGIERNAAGRFRIILQGADATFNPARLPVVYGEPSPRSAIDQGVGWFSYVYSYHSEF